MNQAIHITTTNGDTYTREGDSFDELIRDAVTEFPYGDITGIKQAPTDDAFDPQASFDSPTDAIEQIAELPDTLHFPALLLLVESNINCGEFGFASECVTEFQTI